MTEYGKVVIDDDGDETCRVFVGNDFVGEISHEEYGWGGMTSVMDLIENLGEALGFEVDIQQNIV
ncbi:MAG: hypothetical protein E6R04_00235 [Spirochaetes bacterium]|nr:MAG: hypothetical protein E6R04_00235 [Spirochaetota bacterium]